MCWYAECHYVDCRGANLAPADPVLKQNISDFIPKATYEPLMIKTCLIARLFNYDHFSQ